MQAFEEETKRVLKKQRLCAAQIDAQLDFLLEEAAITKRQLLDKQEEFRRKKSRHSDASSAATTTAATAVLVRSPAPASENVDKSNSSCPSTSADRQDSSSKDDSDQARSNQDETQDDEQQQQQATTNRDEGANADTNDATTRRASVSENQSESVSGKSRVFAEEEDSEVDNILQGFIHRVRLLNVEKNVADELKAIHIALSKYSKQIDKVLRCLRSLTRAGKATDQLTRVCCEQTFCNDITNVCRSQQFDHTLVCRLVAEYLYQDGQIDAADAICQVRCSVALLVVALMRLTD